MSNPNGHRLPLAYYERRLREVTEDLETARASKHPGRKADVAALEEYVRWLTYRKQYAEAGAA